MVKKGIIEEIFSKARFADDPFIYKVIYRNFEQRREVNLPDFIIESDNFQCIPATRIQMIKKNSEIIFQKKIRDN